MSHAAYICPAFLHMEREVSRRLPSQAAVTPAPSPLLQAGVGRARGRRVGVCGPESDVP